MPPRNKADAMNESLLDDATRARGQQVRGEVLLQTAVYCGVAAAEDSFRIASEVFKEMRLS